MSNKETVSHAIQAMNHGQTKEFKIPSGFKVTIREMNGADDDILSNEALAKDLSNLDLFLSSLILSTDLPISSNKKNLSPSDVRKMALRDKYYIVFVSRIHTMGPVINISYDWGKENGGKVDYTINLTEEFVWDLDKEFPEPGSSDYQETYFKLYEQNPYNLLEFTLDSGKVLRFTPLNGESEKYLLKLNRADSTRNSDLKARGLELQVEGKWMKVESFHFFTKRDMIQLNTTVTQLDPAVAADTELENPKNNQIIKYPVLATPDFFFPEEI